MLAVFGSWRSNLAESRNWTRLGHGCRRLEIRQRDGDDVALFARCNSHQCSTWSRKTPSGKHCLAHDLDRAPMPQEALIGQSRLAAGTGDYQKRILQTKRDHRGTTIRTSFVEAFLCQLCSRVLSRRDLMYHIKQHEAADERVGQGGELPTS